jgi:hypothetical protein
VDERLLPGPADIVYIENTVMPRRSSQLGLRSDASERALTPVGTIGAGDLRHSRPAVDLPAKMFSSGQR